MGSIPVRVTMKNTPDALHREFFHLLSKSGNRTHQIQQPGGLLVARARPSKTIISASRKCKSIPVRVTMKNAPGALHREFFHLLGKQRNRTDQIQQPRLIVGAVLHKGIDSVNFRFLPGIFPDSNSATTWRFPECRNRHPRRADTHPAADAPGSCPEPSAPRPPEMSSGTVSSRRG